MTNDRTSDTPRVDAAERTYEQWRWLGWAERSKHHAPNGWAFARALERENAGLRKGSITIKREVALRILDYADNAVGVLPPSYAEKWIKIGIELREALAGEAGNTNTQP